MQVPVYSQPQARVGDLPGVRVENPVTPLAAGGAAAAQLAQVGQSLGQATDTLMQAQVRLERERDADMATRAETALRTKYLEFHKQARERRGEAAYGLTADAGKWFDDNTAEIDKGLENDRQRRAFGQLVQRFRVSSVGSLADYEGEQRTRSAIVGQEARVETARETAAVDPLNAEALLDAKKVLDGGAKDLARLNGWPPEVTEKYRADQLSKLHDGVTRALVAQGKFGEAAKHLKDNLAEISDPKTRESLQTFVRNSTDVQVGDDKATEVWGKFGPKSDGAPIELDKMEQALREDPALAENPTARKAATAALRERAQATESSRGQRLTANTNAVTDQLNKKVPLSQVMKSPEWQDLTPTQQRKIEQMIEQDAYQAESRAAARASRAASEAQRAFAMEGREEIRLRRQQSMLFLQNADKYLEYSDPSKLRGMSRDQVRALQVDIGTEATGRLLSVWDSMEKGTGKIDATIDQDLFNTVADRAGLKPFDAKKSEDERRQLGSLKFFVEQQIDAAQQRAKRPLTREEKQGVMQQVVDDQVMVQSRVWFDKQVPAALLQPADQERAYVEVGGQRVFSRTIPAADRVQIIQALQAKGRPVSEKSIAELYMAGKNASR